MCDLRASLLFVLACIVIQPAVAQLAPTGEHYAGRPSDTGYGGTFANATGTFSTAVPLDLPTARGDLPIPLQISYGTQSVGAAGVGWDVPLSYLRQDSIFAYRRPSSAAETPPAPRQRTTLSLFGQRADLVRDGNSWVARSGTLELSIWQDGNTWLVYDGSGRTYSFEQPSSLSSTGLWLLTSISGPASASGASVKLTYQIQNNLPLNGGAATGLSIDLTQIDYNFLPPARPFEPPGCPKNEISLSYQPYAVQHWYNNVPAPLSISILGNTVVVRQTTLTGVDVKSRVQCRDAFQSLRNYTLQYGADADTGLPRLQNVRMSGRQGTPEANTTVPIGNYQYGSATDKDTGTLHYDLTMTIPIPPEIVGPDSPHMSGTVTDGSVKNPGSDSDVGYAMWQSLTDVTGDGRPDLIFKKNNQLWVAYNQPAANGSTTIGAAAQSIVPLSDATFSKGAFSTQTSVSARYTLTGNRNTTDIWREAIDVNGDGRVDIVDAAEEPDHWVVYLNTPGPDGRVAWVRRSFSVLALEKYLEALGHHLDGPYLPLSRRSTGTGLTINTCWRWDGSQWLWFPQGFGSAACPGRQQQSAWGPEATYVEWDLIDVNGDGYPDFVFDSSPVDWYASPPPQHGAPGTEVGAAAEQITFGPQQAAGQLAVNGRPPCDKSLADCANLNDIKVAYNVAGVRFDVDQKVFSKYVSLSAPGATAGVAKWSCDSNTKNGACQYFYDGKTYTPQYQLAGFADVNGDGLVDRVVGYTAYLGTGGSFSNAYITLPNRMALVINNQPQICNSKNQKNPTSHQLLGLRDLTGDGLPDYYVGDSGQGQEVWIGTGTGFVGPVPISSRRIPFRWSDQTETCNGTSSWTDGGLFDIDGDGRPDILTVGEVSSGNQANVPVFWASQLVGGQGPGRPEAGRLTQFDNGYGAVTQLSYVSAKQRTDNAVPFPENVVTGVTVTGANHLGGSLAGSRFAYGNGSLIFDSALDRFVFPGYGRSVELQLFDVPGPLPPVNTGRAVGLALVTDRYGLAPFSNGLSQHDRWVREKQVGQVSQLLTIHDITTTDPWGLLDTPALAQFVTSAVEVTWDANYYQTPASAYENAFDCAEMFLPYDYQQSVADNFGAQGIDSCRAHGFAHPTVVTSWRGTSSPPSDQNVQTATRVLSVDDYGQPLQLQLQNDLFRSDDDLCVNNVYATSSSGTFPRVVHALASRRIGTVCGSAKSVTLAYDWWNYDNLSAGAVSAGLMTSHFLERHATDNGALLGTVHVFDATYDGLDNLNTVRTTRGTATRTVTFTFDPFGLVPTSTQIDAIGVPSRFSTTTYDPLSLQVVGTTDANGTVYGITFDGFDRPTLSTLTPPGGNVGVLSTASYLGFDGSDPAGRRVIRTQFADPISQAQVSTASGPTALSYLDELGRMRHTELSLGSDYANQTLVVGARQYDGMGRVSFEADPYPTSVNLSNAYGTSYFFTPDGDLNCLIRGTGPQELTHTSDLAAERFPTCLIHRYQSNTDIYEMQDASSLLANSPQAGVLRRSVQTAIGRTIERSTVSSAGVRLEDATFLYDHLGHKTSITRYLNPSDATLPTSWTTRFDSLGQVIQFIEPVAPSRFYNYSDWGELIEAEWKIGANSHELLQNFDALGRLTMSQERNNGLTDPQSINKFTYDVAVNASPLVTSSYTLGQLASAASPGETISFSYDALGRTNGEVFTDQLGGLYVQKVTYHADGRANTLEFDLPDRGYQPEVASYAYDSGNRMRSITYTDDSGTTQLYNADTIDLLGRVRAAHFGANTAYLANYSDTGRELIVDAEVSSALGSHRIAFGPFDPLNRETSRREFVNGDLTGLETDSTYDGLGQLATVRVKNGAFTSSDWQFSYDAQGNITRLIDANNPAEAVLLLNANNDHDRLCRIDYGLSQPRQKATCNVVHDALGNVLSEPTRTGIRQYAYFTSGQMRSISGGGAQATFSYGPFGDWQTLDVLGSPTQEWHERRYGGLIDWRSVTSGIGTQAMVSRFVPGPGGIVASRRGTGNDWVFGFGEPRGNRFFTNIEGAFIQTIGYQPFGVASSQGVVSSSGDYSENQWNGGDALTALGVSQLGARTYDPVIGRFLSRDPLVIARRASNSNPYAFAANDPVNRVDPTGLDFGDCDNPTDCASTPDLPAEPGGGGPSGGGAGRALPPAPTAPRVSTGPQTPGGILLRAWVTMINGWDPPLDYDFDAIAKNNGDPRVIAKLLNNIDSPAREAHLAAEDANLARKTYGVAIGIGLGVLTGGALDLIAGSAELIGVGEIGALGGGGGGGAVAGGAAGGVVAGDVVAGGTAGNTIEGTAAGGTGAGGGPGGAGAGGFQSALGEGGDRLTYSDGFERGEVAAEQKLELVLGKYPENVQYVSRTPGTVTVDVQRGWTETYNAGFIRAYLESGGSIRLVSPALSGTYEIEVMQILTIPGAPR